MIGQRPWLSFVMCAHSSPACFKINSIHGLLQLLLRDFTAFVRFPKRPAPNYHLSVLCNVCRSMAAPPPLHRHCLTCTENKLRGRCSVLQGHVTLRPKKLQVVENMDAREVGYNAIAWDPDWDRKSHFSREMVGGPLQQETTPPSAFRFTHYQTF